MFTTGSQWTGSMYDDGVKQLDIILELVNKCPEKLREQCFAILLQGYVDSENSRGLAPSLAMIAPSSGHAIPAPEPETDGGIPTDVRNRFAALAKRLGVNQDQLETLFDFTADPFVFHPIDAPGSSNADKTRNVTLLVAIRTYLATGSWTADWSEVKLRCVDLNCYDAANHAAYLKKGKGQLFRTVDIGKTIELSATGRTNAEQVLKGLIAST